MYVLQAHAAAAAARLAGARGWALSMLLQLPLAPAATSYAMAMRSVRACND
jgi:hypothetical protein